MTPGSQTRLRLSVGSVVLLFAAVLGVRGALLDRDFVVNSEGLATGWALSSARNHVRYGLAASRGAGILNSGEVNPGGWVIYAHHPPLTTWTAAVPLALFGVNEWTARLAPALFSISTTVLLFWLACRAYGTAVGALTAIIYAFCPMTLALGDMAEYTNAPLVFFGVAAVGAYVLWWERGGAARAALASAMFVLGALSDWPIFYLVPILAAHALLTRRVSLAVVTAFCAVSALILLLLASWMVWAGGDVSAWHQLSVRMRARVTVGDWFERVILHHQGRLHTWPVLVLSSGWAVAILGARWRRGRDPLAPHWLPLLLLAWGWANVLAAVDGNYRHEWWSMVLTPGLALGAALGVVSLGSAPVLARRPAVRVAALAIGIVCFLVLSAWTARAFTRQTWLQDAAVDLKVLGTAIAQAAAEDEGVLTTVETTHGALWFYADRQLRTGITSIEALDGALRAGPYRLFSRYEQPSGPAPAWFVMPVAHAARYAELTAALDARYPRRSSGDVVIYPLRAP